MDSYFELENREAERDFERRQQAFRPYGGGPRWTRQTDLPGDTDWPGYDDLRGKHFAVVAERRKVNESLHKVRTDLESANRDYATDAAAAIRAGKKVPTDPRPNLREKAEALQRNLEVLDAAVNQSADEIEALVHAERGAFRRVNAEARTAALELARAQYAGLVESLAHLHKVECQDSWLMGRKATAQPLCSAELNQIGDGLDGAELPTRVLYVDQSNFRKLEAGEEAQAVDGTTLPAGTPLSVVKVTHSPKGLKQSPFGRASDRG